MKRNRWTILFLLGGILGMLSFLNTQRVRGDETMPASETPKEAVANDASVSLQDTQAAKAKELPEFKEIAEEAEPIQGLLAFHQNKDNLFMEVKPEHLNTDYIIIISISKGIGMSSLYAGMSWSTADDDMVWQFRKQGDRIQIVRRNFRYQANQGTREAKALELAYTDSILFSLPIMAKGPSGGDIIDLTSIFMSDLPMISTFALPGFTFARDRSNWNSIKAFSDNMELDIAATYSGSPLQEMSTVIDARGVTVNVHYSISRLQNTGYTPRLADDRVGYFNSAIKNLSKNVEENNFVRYINRWNLKKQITGAEKSLPEKPIVFWIEKTVPFEYRKAIRDGILEWNKAFEQAGFYDAIDVRQQEDNDTWDPEDIRYNTIRWSPAGLGFSIGPSRVNPMTGEILDADVVLDVGFINSWNRTFELYRPDDLAEKFSLASNFEESMKNEASDASYYHRGNDPLDETLFFSQQMGFADTFFDIMACDVACDEPKPEEPKPEEPKPEEPKPEEPKPEEPKPEESAADAPQAEEASENAANAEAKPEESAQEAQPAQEAQAAQDEQPKEGDAPEASAEEKAEAAKKKYEEERKKLIDQGLRFLATHEVGHTLGLRHNFKQSTNMSIEDLNNPEKTAQYGYAGSIMEYMPVNIMPKGMPQGDYQPTKIGQYDYWVIEYGYKDFGKGTEDEVEDLKKIAQQQSKPEYNYSTDEDCYGGTDPLVNIFDLGNDPLEYAKLRARLVKEIMPGLNDRIVKDGESYDKMLSRFAALMSWHGSGMLMATKYIGGIHVNRDHKGDSDSRAPFVVVDAQKQRDALAFLNEEVFGVNSYQFPAELYNYLAPNRWRHWGSDMPSRYDLNIHTNILSWQKAYLSQLFSTATLSRLADSELRVEPGQDVFTIAEMLESLTTAIFKELETLKDGGEFSIQNQAIRSVRRNLQRMYYERLAEAAIDSRSISAEDDFNALARLQLIRIRTSIQAVLAGNAKLDSYTMAHLTELEIRITQTLDATISRSY